MTGKARKIGLALLAAIGLLIFTNAGYFWQNLKFTFHKPEVLELPVSGKQEQVLLEPNVLIIESLGVKVPVLYVDEVSEKVFQQALQKGVVHYPGTALPGEFGNVYIFGHSSDNAWAKGNYKTAFALLPRIEKGAKILISDASGKPFVYEVLESFVTGAKDIQYLGQRNYEKKLLTLQTSYPIGTSLKRYIVIAEMKD